MLVAARQRPSGSQPTLRITSIEPDGDWLVHTHASSSLVARRASARRCGTEPGASSSTTERRWGTSIAESASTSCKRLSGRPDDAHASTESIDLHARSRAAIAGWIASVPRIDLRSCWTARVTASPGPFTSKYGSPVSRKNTTAAKLKTSDHGPIASGSCTMTSGAA